MNQLSMLKKSWTRNQQSDNPFLICVPFRITSLTCFKPVCSNPQLIQIKSHLNSLLNSNKVTFPFSLPSFFPLLNTIMFDILPLPTFPPLCPSLHGSVDSLTLLKPSRHPPPCTTPTCHLPPHLQDFDKPNEDVLKHHASISELKRNFMEAVPEQRPSEWDKRLSTHSPFRTVGINGQPLAGPDGVSLPFTGFKYLHSGF